MFCKICYSSGNTSFNTHNVRDGANNVICPILLNTKCKNCGYYGHISKYCKNNSIASTIKYNNHKISKNVAFHNDVKSYSISQKYTYNPSLFSYLKDENDTIDNDETCLEFDLTNIIWGVGHRDLIGVSWADVVL